MIVIALMMLTITYDVLARFRLAAPTDWAYPLNSAGVLVATVLAVPHLWATGRHIAMDLVHRALPPAVRRGADAVTVLAGCFLGAVLAVSALRSMVVAASSGLVGRHVRGAVLDPGRGAGRCRACSWCWPRCCSRRPRPEAHPLAAVPGRSGRTPWWRPRSRPAGDHPMIPDGAVVGLAVVLLLVLIALRTPIFVALAVAGIVGLLGLDGFTALELVPLSLVSQLQEYALVAAPLYVLLGEALAVSGLGRDLFAAAHRWFTRVPGGLAASAVGSSTLFGAMSGVSISSVAVIGRMAVPEMLERGYRPAFAERGRGRVRSPGHAHPAQPDVHPVLVGHRGERGRPVRRWSAARPAAGRHDDRLRGAAGPPAPRPTPHPTRSASPGANGSWRSAGSPRRCC